MILFSRRDVPPLHLRESHKCTVNLRAEALRELYHPIFSLLYTNVTSYEFFEVNVRSCFEFIKTS